ncbi:hypothetical protein D3C84_708010 [compost metagenome]
MQNAGLGGGIERSPGRTELAAGTADVDHYATAGQVHGDLLGEDRRRHQIDVEGFQPLRAIRRQPLIGVEASVIDQNVEPAEAGEGGRDTGVDVFVALHVAGGKPAIQ